MNRIIDTGEDYRTYRGLPALVGLSSIPDAIRAGLSVDDCVSRLKRFHYALKRLHRLPRRSMRLARRLPISPRSEMSEAR